MAFRVTKERFGELVELAIAELPPEFSGALDEVSIEIRDTASPADRKKVGIAADALLLGLYTGRPRTRRSVEDGPVLPDSILLFQSEIEQVCRTEAQLVEQIRTTVMHEIGHHFGMDEDDLDAVGFV